MEVEEGRSGVYQLLVMTERWLDDNPDVLEAIEEAMKVARKKLAQTVSLYEEKRIVDWAMKALREADPDAYRAATLESPDAVGDNGVVDTKQG